MKILELNQVDPLQVLHLNLLALEFPLTPKHVTHIRRSDPRPFPFFAIYAVEDDKVLGQVGVFRLPMVSLEGREEVFISDLDDHPLALASVYGAPMASEVVHVFGVLGTCLVIQTGCCGALADGITAGDLFIATEAYCGEGASQYYLPGKKTVTASLDPQEWISEKGNFHTGHIYPTSALFAEGMEEVEAWFRVGFSAVDMETAATFAVACYFGMDRASILYAFDNPRKKEHIFLEDAEKNDRHRIGNEKMIEVVLEKVKQYASRNPQ